MEIKLITKIVVAIVTGLIFSEFIGYWLHILLHSNKIQWLSRSHMIHHLKLYGPKMPKRSERYKIAVKNRAEVLGIGMEWMAPVSITLVIIFLVGWLLSIRILYIGIFTVSALLWGYILFNYMHDALHIEGFWMLKNRYLKDRFLKIRGRHDIHHVHLSDDGRMNKNFGICFFLFDRIFKTFYPVQGPFNEKGFQASLQRYDYIFKISE